VETSSAVGSSIVSTAETQLSSSTLIVGSASSVELSTTPTSVSSSSHIGNYNERVNDFRCFQLSDV
jgi:hypothetical protein